MQNMKQISIYRMNTLDIVVTRYPNLLEDEGNFNIQNEQA